ncbi:recombinase family protein [uncultured Tissierella sp.]|uniref:recombinase family protein n=1 Tax=uncultured Tissierella sp. TaxID=448160 RepID=UPI00280624DE|nr:recombinase family protein [uncultured Tissierella sp.]MDU5081287.1 recombinase family protein [Bacillota bacterium]
MKKIIFIPPKSLEYKKLRVAAYCRVSTLNKIQRNSLQWQIGYYTNMIQDNPDWIFAGIFYDVGKSGLRRKGRIGLDKMLKKATKGKIDYILVKSISRLSRDTVEVLKIIRYLRERGINMHFENENLDSIRVDKEFEITLRSMIAQDESKNTSENIKWGFQRKFERGEIFTKYKNFMGYTCVEGELVIVPEQAEVVRKIFELYLKGLSFGQIKGYLESMDIKTVTGNKHWDTTTIQKMLRNEKYKGDTMLQKTYTEDFMTGKKVRNTGQIDSYYISNSHPAIVSDEVFDKVQEEMDKRSRVVYKEDGTIESKGKRYNSKYLLGNILECGYCGAAYRRRTERGRVVWRCATRMEEGRESCADSPTLNEEWIKGILGEVVCGNGNYDEGMFREWVDRILVFGRYMDICCKNGDEIRIRFDI